MLDKARHHKDEQDALLGEEEALVSAAEDKLGQQRAEQDALGIAALWSQLRVPAAAPAHPRLIRHA